MLSTKKSAQTLVFIAFFPFITIPTAKSGLNLLIPITSGFFYDYCHLLNKKHIKIGQIMRPNFLKYYIDK